MFGGDDDDDFAPANNSKLASLFSSKSVGEGNSSLTYTAPKQPKRAESHQQQNRLSSVTQTGSNIGSNTAQPSASNKLGIIIVKAVNTYKLEDGTYNLQGKLGAAVLGNSTICVYQLLLYKGKQNHITSTKITPTFQFTVQPNNYCTFYDDQKQNWSLHFDHNNDAEEFSKEIGLARVNSQNVSGGICNLLTQDLSIGEGPPASVGDMVEIFYSVRLFTEKKMGQLVENNLQAEKPQRVKIRKNVWEEGLIGATKGSKRIILLPPNLVGPWKQEVPADTSLAVEVQVSRLKQAKGSREGTPNVLSSLADSGADSAVDSSTDETSIKARGASISEALTASPKTNKANIISRMARMGQATLPLKGAVACNPSDTEDSEEDAKHSAKPPIIFKPSPKVRSAKTPPSPEKNPVGSNITSGPPQQMTVYQSVPAWQQQAHGYTMGQYGISQLDGQLYPLVPNQTISSHQLMSNVPAATPPGMPSSSDGHLSVFLSETRTHNTEVRIGMAKVADKVDQVLAKLDSSTHRPAVSGALLDSASLVSGVERLVSDNERLRAELADKGNKIDVQNDRIYQLLNTNHKYLEQSTSSSHDLQAVVAGLRAEVARLEGGEREAERQRRELAAVVAEREAALRSVAGELREAADARDAAEKTLATLRHSLAEMRDSNDNLKASLCEVAHRLRLHKMDAEQKSSERFGNKQVVDEVKKVMNVVYKSLHREFINGEMYLGENIKEILAVTIRDITCQLVDKEKFAMPVTAKAQTMHSGVSLGQQERSQPVIKTGEMSKETLAVSLESCSDMVDVSSHLENSAEGKSVSAGYCGMPKELLDVSSEPISTPAVNLPDGIIQIERDPIVIPSEPYFNTVEDLNLSADGPRDLDNSSSDMIAGYAGDIPALPLAKLPGEMDLSVNVVYTDSDMMPESFSHLRVTSDVCVSATAPTAKVLDHNRRELKSAVTPDSRARPTMQPTTTDSLKVDNQQTSTNKEEEEAVTGNLRESSLERKPWRSEPPPLFDDDEDEDDWLS